MFREPGGALVVQLNNSSDVLCVFNRSARVCAAPCGTVERNTDPVRCRQLSRLRRWVWRRGCWWFSLTLYIYGTHAQHVI